MLLFVELLAAAMLARRLPRRETLAVTREEQGTYINAIADQLWSKHSIVAHDDEWNKQNGWEMKVFTNIRQHIWELKIRPEFAPVTKNKPDRIFFYTRALGQITRPTEWLTIQ